jgi:hypothetical protein
MEAPAPVWHRNLEIGTDKGVAASCFSLSESPDYTAAMTELVRDGRDDAVRLVREPVRAEQLSSLRLHYD